MALERAPADGERAALVGYSAQLKVGAAEILGRLADGTLEKIAVCDREAGRLDDLQVLTARSGTRRVDAYQVKWSDKNAPVAQAEFRGLLLDALADQARLCTVWHGRLGQTVEVFAHVHTGRPPSRWAFRGHPGCTLPGFVADVWQPAQDGVARDLRQVPRRWRPYVTELAKSAGLRPGELLARARHIELAFEQPLPEDTIAFDEEGRQFLRDLKSVVVGLLDNITDKSRETVVSTERLLERLGPDWLARWQPRSEHRFPVPGDYQAISPTEEELDRALEDSAGGYIVVTGSPGAGKSTLLTRRLAGRTAARYYAYVPDEVDRVTRCEPHAFLSDLLLELDHGRGLRTLAPPAEQLPLLRKRLVRRLAELGAEQQTIVLIDGLDHVHRDGNATEFMRQLPSPVELPPGVTVVLGTRSIDDLPAALKEVAREPGRHIVVQPLDKRATYRLAGAAGRGEEHAEAVWSHAAGHPLLTKALLALDLAQVSQLPGLEGDIGAYYANLWHDVRNDSDVVALLGELCRMRGAIDPAWLQRTGTPVSTRLRVERVARHLFIHTASGWRFFHDSFREFLCRRTSESMGRMDEALSAAFHAAIAARCAATPPNEPQAWDEIHHRLRAGDPAGAARLATPSRFRHQLNALRPPGAVLPQIREAATALETEHDGVLVARLALASAEVRQRMYTAEITDGRLTLMADLGHIEFAIEHLRYISDGTVGNNRTRSALGLALYLYDAGHETDARRVFADFEPIGVLAGNGETLGTTGHWEALETWAGLAALLHGPEYVNGHVRVLGDREREQGVEIEANLLWRAAICCEERGRSADADMLLANLHDNPYGAQALAELEARRGELDRALARETDEPVCLAESLIRARRFEAAGALVPRLPVIAIPEREYNDREALRWRQLYRVLCVRAAADPGFDAAAEIPASPHDRARQRIATSLRALAVLWAQHQHGATVGAAEIVAVVRDGVGGSRGRSAGTGSVGAARDVLRASAIALAAEVGGAGDVWDWWCSRWPNPGHGDDGGVEVLAAFRSAGIAAELIETRLQKYETALVSDSDAYAESWIAIGQLWFALGRQDCADRALRAAVESDFRVLWRKDYQVTDWTKLLGPLLRDPAQQGLAEWLVAQLAELDTYAEVGAAADAAETMLEIIGERSASDVLRYGRELCDRRVLDHDDVIRAVLKCTMGEQLAGWWTVLADLYIPIGGTPFDLPAGSDAQLKEIAARVAVEGRPSDRLSWRRELGRRGLAFPASDLEPGDETPTASVGRSEPTETRREPLDVLDSIEAGTGTSQDRRYLAENVADLGSEMRARAITALEDSDYETILWDALSRSADDAATAWGYATRALDSATPRDWRLDYAGGPAISAARTLLAIDPSTARPVIFRAFSQHAATDEYLLPDAARELTRTRDVFPPSDYVVAAHDALEFLAAVLGSEPPELARRTHDDESAALSNQEVLCETAFWLLTEHHAVAWQAAQRCVLGLLFGDLAQATSARLAKGAAPRERAIAVLDAAVSDGYVLQADDVDYLNQVALTDRRLDTASAAGELLRRSSMAPPARPHEPLPTWVAAVGPRREFSDAEDPATALAYAANVDLRQLTTRVDAEAAERAGRRTFDERAAAASKLGYEFFRMSTSARAEALAVIATQLVDARCVSTDDALTALGTWPLYDRELLRRRPQRRPAAVASATPLAERTSYLPDWLSGIAGAEQRLARGVDGWAVIGEFTEIALLEDSGPLETRRQVLSSGEGAASFHRVAAELAAAPTLSVPGSSSLLHGDRAQVASPSGWLAIDPDLAASAGMAPDRSDPSAWTLKGAPAIRTIWWRSGWLTWPPRWCLDEVGEGWLVLATREALNALRIVEPTLGLDWLVERVQERQANVGGHRACTGRRLATS